MLGKLGKLFFGTSGWSYKDWEGVFYEPGESKLRKYSRVFNAVEIDSTFYSYPSPELVNGLAKAVPEDFTFTAKIPSLITHSKKLDLNKTVEDDLRKFLELMMPLRKSGKLGPLLIQLPPKFIYSDHFKALRDFLGILPSDFRFAIEFRDQSWLRDDVLNTLSRHEIAYTIVDEPLLPPDLHVTTDFAYVRWHGKGSNPWYYYHYRRGELEEWRPRLEELRERTSRIYGFFNNHFHGYAVHNCLQVLEILGIITSQQRRILEEVEKALQEPKISIMTLSEITPPEKLPEDIEDLLGILTDKRRLGRAKEMDPSLVKVDELTERYISARIKDYVVIIDLEERVIIHNCADWSRVGMRLNFCKHLAALMLNLDKSHARKILDDIVQNRPQWTFKEI